VALVLEHHPLPMHPHARLAALAVQAARRQGKAWPLHDALFAHRRALGRDDILRYASEIGLDAGRFTADLDDQQVAAEVDADTKLAMSVGARGTPASFVNGRPVVGAKPYSEFASVVEDELAKANALLQAGTPLAEVYLARCRANVDAFAKASKAAK